ncbi:MAG: GDP-L-fucose synthase [Candidatus Omnitrophota bacterium]
MQSNSRILIIGHNDSLENSLRNYFSSLKFSNVYTNTKSKLDVLSQSKVQKFFKDVRPEYVFLGSLRSGGIAVNQKYPAVFIYENLQAQNNIIHSAWQGKVKKLVYFGASCIYPKAAKQPIMEDSLYQGPMETTSEAYSTSKLAGVKLCQMYRQQYGFNAICVVPATLYGPGSDTNLETAHVMGSLIAKFHQGVAKGLKEVEVWGTGKPRREFLYVDDFVDGVIFLMKNYNSGELVNLGVGSDVTIKYLASVIAKVSGYKGKIVFDASKPDGTMRKLLDSSRVSRLGWKPKVKLEEGINKTYQWFKNLR